MITLYNAVMAGSFPAILLLLTLLTGAFWLLDRFKFAPARRAAAQSAVNTFDTETADKIRVSGGEAEVEAVRNSLADKHLKMPWWLEYTAGFFTVIAAVFVLRSFVAEPFRIPSSSMMPTLQDGDLILVNKFTWGLRMPVFDTVLIPVSSPKRGDPIVFRFPENPSIDYIKRVVALPGDVVEYSGKKLILNGKPVPTTTLPDFFDPEAAASGLNPAMLRADPKLSYMRQFKETMPNADGDIEHRVLNNPFLGASMGQSRIHRGQWKNACTYLTDGIRCTVPAGHYFAMGDNRDNSEDSRYWGFVPDKNIVGKAFFIWMNFSTPSRIGAFK